jgi:septal ring factor EnvC (AmiA/AmiB activator)
VEKKNIFARLLMSIGKAKSQAETQAEKGDLEEADLNALETAVSERDSFKTQLDASLSSEKKLQGELKTAQDALATLQATHTTVVEAKTKAETDLGVAKAALEGKGENPYSGGKENPKQDVIDPKFKTSYDIEKYGE